ncbi:MAG: hypothetical protein ABF959_13675, partial [Gluconobacter albidus]
IVYSLIPFFLSAIIFIFFDLDTSSPRKDLGIEDKSIENSLRSIDAQLQKFLFPLAFSALNEHSTQEAPSNEQRQTPVPKFHYSAAPSAATSPASRAKPNNNCHRRSERSPNL